jgi:hypothetical protein
MKYLQLIIALTLTIQLSYGQENLETVKETYKNGQLKLEGQRIDGQKSGTWKYYYDNGQLRQQETYNEDGIPKGTWIWYDKNGEFKTKINMGDKDENYTNIQMGKMKISINDDEAAESDSTETDTTDSRDNEYLIFDVGVKGLFFNNAFDVNGNTGEELYDIDIANSEYFGIYNMYSIPNKSYLNLEIGWGFEFNSYQFENNIVLRDSINSTSISLDTTRNFNKNSFKTTYAKIPLMLTFTSKKEDFKLSVGGMVGAKIGSRIKTKYTEGDNEVKEIVKNDFNVNPFTATGVFRAYYKWIGVFGAYDLTPLFKTSSNTAQVNPFSVGVSFDL